MPNPDRDWFADIQPIVGATRATRATLAGESRKTAISADAALLPKGEGSGATLGNEAAAVAPVAQPLPGEGHTGAMPRTAQFSGFRQSVAPVAPVAPEIEAEVQRQAEFEDRAAIVEYDGGAPRAWAEGFARLDQSVPLLGFTPRRWQQVIDDGGRFLDRWASMDLKRASGCGRSCRGWATFCCHSSIARRR